jgi:hypothetical protein
MWLAWSEEYGETIDEAKAIRAPGPIFAAERWAKLNDRERNYSVKDVVVFVLSAEPKYDMKKDRISYDKNLEEDMKIKKVFCSPEIMSITFNDGQVLIGERNDYLDIVIRGHLFEQFKETQDIDHTNPSIGKEDSCK